MCLLFHQSVFFVHSQSGCSENGLQAMTVSSGLNFQWNEPQNRAHCPLQLKAAEFQLEDKFVPTLERRCRIGDHETRSVRKIREF